MSADAAAEDDDEAATPVGEVDTSAEVVREGFLTKQSTGKSKLLMRNWRKRWFVLRANGTLVWSGSDKDRKPRGALDVRGCAGRARRVTRRRRGLRVRSASDESEGDDDADDADTAAARPRAAASPPSALELRAESADDARVGGRARGGRVRDRARAVEQPRRLEPVRDEGRPLGAQPRVGRADRPRRAPLGRARRRRALARRRRRAPRAVA